MAAPKFTPGQRSMATRIGLALFTAAMIIALTQVPWFRLGVIQRLELSTIDYRFQHRGTVDSVHQTPHVVIVEISEDSRRSLPERFPWPRSYYAHLLRNLKAAGATAVGIDLLFSGADSYSPANDTELANAIHETGIAVLAGKREADNDAYVTSSANEDFGNIFYPVNQSIGLVNIRNDVDGVYRTYNTMFVLDSGSTEKAIPTLGFAVLNKALGLSPMTVPKAHAGGFTYAGREIPGYDAASFLINYAGPNGTFPHIRFHDVIDDESFTTLDEKESGEEINTFSDPTFGYLHDGTFAGKIALVGVTVPEYKDLFPVPITRGAQRRDNLMYGVEIHANVIESVLRNSFLSFESPLAEGIVTTLLVLLTFMATALFREVKTRHHLVVGFLGVLFALALIAGILIVAAMLFVKFNIVVSVVSAVLAVLGGHVVSMTHLLISERRERMLIKSMFSTYVNPSLVEELVAHPEKLVLGGRREELTVLFSDIEAFTARSERLAPEDLVSILNEYFSVMSALIFRNNGTLDKYEGDAIMAFWGAPIPQADHALRACRTAIEMQEGLVSLNHEWTALGRSPLRIRIGINTGDMVVGNMGAVGKFAYTVIGDSVNLASRLESANREYRTGIMVSHRTYELVKGAIHGRELDRIAVRGRTEPVRVYELLALKGGEAAVQIEEFLARYAEGMDGYFSRRWHDAERAFEGALALRQDDPPTRMHLERIRTYQHNPPPENWDGVFVLKTK
jgi:adenylate cyclase